MAKRRKVGSGRSREPVTSTNHEVALFLFGWKVGSGRNRTGFYGGRSPHRCVSALSPLHSRHPRAASPDALAALPWGIN
eukprot:scaffold157110_cov28-Tisochrysis_lutea.AAC.1